MLNHYQLKPGKVKFEYRADGINGGGGEGFIPICIFVEAWPVPGTRRRVLWWIIRMCNTSTSLKDAFNIRNYLFDSEKRLSYHRVRCCMCHTVPFVSSCILVQRKRLIEFIPYHDYV